MNRKRRYRGVHIPGALVLVLLSACTDSSPPAAVPDSTASAALAHASSLPGVAGEARNVCDSVAQKWRAIPAALVEIRDTVAQPVNRNSIDQSLPDEQLAATPACVVLARADSGLPEGAKDPYWPADWAALWIISADGPGGSMLTYQRGLVRCQVHDQWDAGDDSDSTYVPSRWQEQTTLCWRHNRLLMPSDTGHPR
jgi:hypothetical protein